MAIIIVIMMLLKKKEENNIVFEEEIKVVERKEKSIVENRSEFFTVSSCVDFYLSYVVDKDSESILNVLDKNFKKDNNINEANVLDKIKTFSEPKEFVAEKMYYEINNNVRHFLCIW